MCFPCSQFKTPGPLRCHLEKREAAEDWGGVLNRNANRNVCVRARVRAYVRMHVHMCAKLCTSQPSPKENPDGSPGQLGNGCVCTEQALSPPPEVRFIRAGGRACSFSLLGFGATRVQTGPVCGQAPSSDLGLEAAN